MIQKMLLGICLVFIIPSLSGQLNETGKRVSLTDGNELYSWCRAYKDVAKARGDEFGINTADGSAAFNAGSCMGYVRAAVDSLPVGEEFSPSPHVKLSQYLDVVFKYLDEHPESRDKEAAILVTKALTQAFPKR